MTERYSFSLTTFSPSGKLVQIEYALAAVAAGAPCVGIKAKDGVVLAAENKVKSVLYEEQSVHKMEKIAEHIGMAYSGMGPDYRILVAKARKIAQEYFFDLRRTDTNDAIGSENSCGCARIYANWWRTSVWSFFINRRLG